MPLTTTRQIFNVLCIFCTRTCPQTKTIVPYQLSNSPLANAAHACRGRYSSAEFGRQNNPVYVRPPNRPNTYSYFFCIPLAAHIAPHQRPTPETETGRDSDGTVFCCCDSPHHDSIVLLLVEDVYDDSVFILVLRARCVAAPICYCGPNAAHYVCV